MNRFLQKHLRPNEQVLLVVRKFPLAHWRSFGLILLLMITPAVLFVPLVRMGSFGFAIIALVWGFGIVWILRTLFVWSLDVWMLTPHRLIDLDQRGLFYREVSECPWDGIQDVRTIQRGIGAYVFDYGTLTVHTGSHAEHVELTHVRHPQRVQDQCFHLRQAYINKQLRDAQGQPPSL